MVASRGPVLSDAAAKTGRGVEGVICLPMATGAVLRFAYIFSPAIGR